MGDIVSNELDGDDYDYSLTSLIDYDDMMSLDDIMLALDELDESSYDSDEYPKYYRDDEESDSPCHCAGCQKFLENDLTSDGVEYVKNAVRDALESGDNDCIAITEWMPFYSYWIDFEDCDD
jgi:hypothetical protein